MSRAKIDQHRVRAPGRVGDLGNAVVRLDLGRVGIEGQPEAFDEALRERRPVDVGIGDHMRVVVADRAIDLAEQLDVGDLPALALEARDDIGDFLAQRGRRGGLAMRARKHRLAGLGMRQVGEAIDQTVQRRQQHPVTRVAQHQRIGEVVDVFRGAGEVDELLRRGRVRHVRLTRSLMKYSTALTS